MKEIQKSIKEAGLKNWTRQHIKQIVIAIVIISAIAGVTMRSVEAAELADEGGGFQGIIAAQDVSLNAKVPGRIGAILVAEGQKVSVGDPIAEITSEELKAKKAQLQAQIEQAKAGEDAARAVVDMATGNLTIAKERVAQAEAGVQASISQRDMASATNDKAINGARTQQVAQAESAYLLMQSTYERAQVLYDGGAISLQRFEEIKTQKEISEQTLLLVKEGARNEDKAAATAQLALAQAGVDASNALLSQAREGVNIAMAQVNQANAGLMAAQGKVQQAQAGIQEIDVYLTESIIKSPINGVVTALNSDVGELVSTGSSIGTISNLDTCWVSVDIDEKQIGQVVEGQEVLVEVLAFPGELFEGRVVTLNKQPDFAVKKATNENGNFDLVSYGVKVELDNTKELLRPGMTASLKLIAVDVN